MSNLGGYQLLTTIAKKVGGPRNLFLLTLGTGAALYAGGSTLVKKTSSALKKKKQAVALAKVYTVKTKGKSNEGLLFIEGDTFKVLEVDGDAALIEKIGDDNNPYFVSRMFLSRISDYKLK